MRLLKTDTLAEVQIKLQKYFKNEDFKMSQRTEQVHILDAIGRYVATDIITDRDMPSFRRSVVDGYAVIASDTFGASESIPSFLKVAGQVQMGKPATMTLKKGEAVYVPTGGMIPDGSDGMVMIEYVELLDSQLVDKAGEIAIYKPATPNGHIMNIGDDFRKGYIIFKKGHRIQFKDIGMLATCGYSEISVFKKPSIAILSTGDEIVDICQEPAFGEIRDINAYAIAAFASECGAEVTEIKLHKDDFSGLLNISKELFLKNDILVMSGGSSAGTKDMTADILHSLGEPGVITHGIAIKPGKPTVIGVSEKDNGEYSLTVGLPGHPMSAIIVFKTVVAPFIKSYYFGNEQKPRSISAMITENIHAGEGRETYQLVTLKKNDSNWIAVPIHAKSGSISQLAEAHGYVCISSLSEGVNVNQTVEVILL